MSGIEEKVAEFNDHLLSLSEHDGKHTIYYGYDGTAWEEARPLQGSLLDCEDDPDKPGYSRSIPLPPEVLVKVAEHQIARWMAFRDKLKGAH